MNIEFIKLNLKENDIVRITTHEAIGVIGKVSKIDVEHDGIVLKNIQETELLAQVENAIDYNTVLFPVSEIKYIFTLNLESKPKE